MMGEKHAQLQQFRAEQHRHHLLYSSQQTRAQHDINNVKITYCIFLQEDSPTKFYPRWKKTMSLSIPLAVDPCCFRSS